MSEEAARKKASSIMSQLKKAMHKSEVPYGSLKSSKVNH